MRNLLDVIEELQDTEANTNLDKKKRWKHNAKKQGLCEMCPPHKGENARGKKHGVKKPKKKDHK